MNRPAAATDRVLVVLLAVLVLFGLAMLSSATGPIAYAKFNSSFWFVKHQILFGLLPGIALFVFCSRFPYRRYAAWTRAFEIITVALLLIVFIPGLGASWGTSKSWISLAGFSLQPSEIAKLTFILALSGWLAVSGSRPQESTARPVAPFFLRLGIVCGLLALEPDIGTVLLIAGVAFVMYFISGARLSTLSVLVAAGAAAGYALIRAAPYRAARLLIFLHPELDPQGIGYHTNQALLAIGSGGFWGLGYGHSRQKFLYLPEVAGDSIFAVLSEELGFALTVIFILFLVAFIYRGARIAARAPDRFGSLLASGIVAWFAVQAVANIGSMVGLLPLTGLTLPFVSYGGTSLAMSLAAAGVLVNISGHN